MPTTRKIAEDEKRSTPRDVDRSTTGKNGRVITEWVGDAYTARSTPPGEPRLSRVDRFRLVQEAGGYAVEWLRADPAGEAQPQWVEYLPASASKTRAAAKTAAEAGALLVGVAVGV